MILTSNLLQRWQFQVNFWEASNMVEETAFWNMCGHNFPQMFVYSNKFKKWAGIRLLLSKKLRVYVLVMLVYKLFMWGSLNPSNS